MQKLIGSFGSRYSGVYATPRLFIRQKSTSSDVTSVTPSVST